MSILIKDMELPTEEEISKCIIIRHDGEVWIVEFDNLIDGGYVACYPTNPMRAIPVPPHGRLIDADALKEYCKEAIADSQSDFIRAKDFKLAVAVTNAFCKDIDDAPTIIKAEGEE